MQDLDLDELDQAVTQIMDQPKGKKVAKRPVAPAAPIEPNQAPQPPPAAAHLDPPTEHVVVNTTASRPLARPVPRKRMRPGAMDIIQRPVPTSAPSRRPNREAISLQPTKPVAPEPPRPAPPTPMAMPAQQPAPEEVSDDLLASINLLEDANKTVEPKVEPPPAPAAESWPDPLDLHGFNDQPSPDIPEPQAEPTPAPTEEPPTIPATPLAPAEPAASPFVTTKVEKRPLGAYAANTPAEPQVPAEPPVPSPEVPKAEMAEASLQSNQHIAEPQPEPDDPRQMAIPQQYHTAQPTPNDAVHDMFDTKEYHAPPRPMHAARSGPGLIIGVVVLIVLVIAVAAIGYLMMTGMLDIRKFW